MSETGAAKHKRLFLAVNLSIATTRKIAEAIEAMRPEAARRGLRVGWVPPANLHVTLKFLGWSNPEMVDAIADRVRAGLHGRKAFELEARGVGAFPTETSARVLWVGVVDPKGVLATLAADVEAWMERLGYEREKRAYHPHVTIGRVREDHGGQGGTGAAEVLAPWREVAFGRSLVREVVLYESKMRAKGSEYLAQARVPLDAPPYRAERQARESDEAARDAEGPAPGADS